MYLLSVYEKLLSYSDPRMLPYEMADLLHHMPQPLVVCIHTDEIKELILNNKFKGEAGHPIDGTINRIVTVDPKFTCHRIIKWWVDGNLIKGTVETLDDDMHGTKLTKAILQNENPSFHMPQPLVVCIHMI